MQKEIVEMDSEQFRQELLEQMTALPPRPYGGAEWRETAEKKARRILAEELSAGLGHG